MNHKKGLLLAAAGMVSGVAFGAGFQLYTEGSAEALGQGGAISGRKGMISQAWYNPSALAGAERPQIMVGSAFASLRTDYRSGTTGIANETMSDAWRVIPHVYYVQPISDKLTGTVSVNAPYGLISEWPDVWAGAAIATYSELRTIYITPSLAWKPMDRLAVSVGFNVVDAEAQLEGTGRKVAGDDIGYGGMISAHLQPVDDWALGIRYQSRVQLDIEGSLKLTSVGTFPAAAALELPSSVNIGLANTTFKHVSIGLDLVWTEWSTYDELNIENPATSALASNKDWDDVISLRLGGEYAWGEDWKFRAGYIWDESPVPDTTRAPEMPGSDRQMVTLGAGWTWNDLTLDAAYSYLWAEDAAMGTEYPLPGTFETTTHLIALSVGYTF